MIMNYYGYMFVSDSDLAHHGIKGQKWGIRRYQNEDGSLTAAGQKRYGSQEAFEAKKAEKPQMSDATKKKLKTAVKVGAAVAGAALVAYGAHKLNNLSVEYLKNGDRRLAMKKEAMSITEFEAYFTKMNAADRYRDYKPITNSTPVNVARTYRSMVDDAGKHGLEGSRLHEESKELMNRVNSGNYSIEERVGALRKIAREHRRRT